MDDVRRATRPEDVEAVRELFREYISTRPMPAFPGFEEELRGLPGKYGPPNGLLLVGGPAPAPVACVGVRPFDPGRCELKRMYVRPAARGRGIGRALLTEAVRFAEAAGYTTMLLDTLPEMTEALQLYASFGFEEIPAYWAHPIPRARFFARRLGPSEAARPGRGTSK
jgi:GNAT superfamily N-acetyltransferase